MSRRFLLFLVAGGIAACVNLLSRIALSEWIAYVPAIVIAYCLGMTTAFALNRLFVFDATQSSLQHQAGWFVAVNLAAVVQTILISLLLARVLLPALGFGLHAETIAHAVGVAVPVVTSYLGHKHLSFAAANRK